MEETLKFSKKGRWVAPNDYANEEGVTVKILRAILDTHFMGLVSCVVAF